MLSRRNYIPTQIIVSMIHKYNKVVLLNYMQMAWVILIVKHASMWTIM